MLPIVKRCLVKNCGKGVDIEANRRLFNFPITAERQTIWLELTGNINLSGKASVSNYRVCSIHFSPSQFTTPLRTKLNRNVVPSLHLPQLALPEQLHQVLEEIEQQEEPELRIRSPDPLPECSTTLDAAALLIVQIQASQLQSQHQEICCSESKGMKGKFVQRRGNSLKHLGVTREAMLTPKEKCLYKMNYVQKEDDSLKCCRCFNTISVFPIHTIKKGKYVCGRCPLDKMKRPIRNFAYEALAQHVHFPCTYEHKGCLKELEPGCLKLHESVCNFKPVRCPQPCEWWDTFDKLYEHYNSQHSGLMLSNRAIIEIKSNAAEHLLLAHDELFFVRIKKTQSNLDVSVVPAKPGLSSDAYKYVIQFLTRWSQSKQPDAKFRMPTRSDFKKLTVRNAVTMYLIEVIIEEVLVPSEKMSKMHESIGKKLQCKFCKVIVVSPIHYCCNEVICTKCLEQNPECVTCTSNILNHRNRALEDIVTGWTYVCKYEECGKVVSSEEKEDHEKTCLMFEFICSFEGCSFKGYYDKLWRHTKTVHQKSVGCLLTKSDTLYWVQSSNFLFIAEAYEEYLDLYCYSRKDVVKNYTYAFRANIKGRPSEVIYIKSTCIPDDWNRIHVSKNMLLKDNTDISSYKVLIEESVPEKSHSKISVEGSPPQA